VRATSLWFANMATLSEAKVAEATAADMIVAQGMNESHRLCGCFDANQA
jgi:hypothetical protein